MTDRHEPHPSDAAPPDDDRYGTVEPGADGPVLRFERHYAAPPADVWSALTDAERLARWSLPAVIEPGVGGSVTFDYGDLGTGSGTVLAWEEPTLLEYEWTETMAGDTWRIRFRLTPEGDGTRLVFEHLAPNPHGPEFAAGWHWYLDRLARELDGDPPDGVTTDAAFDRLLAEYTASAD